jgi:hypothetical protein
MHLEKLSPSNPLHNLSGAEHAILRGSAPPKNIPIVSLSGFRLNEVRALDRLHRYVASPAATNKINAAARRSAKNIDNWSSYLPAKCVDAMVSFGWDRTT